ncbi:group 10 secretory phospholipase A2 [Pelodytes ibericus]
MGGSRHGIALKSGGSAGGSAALKGISVKSHILHRRGITELAGAIHCATGRTALVYIGYGCYCGLGGRGMPKDKADWCCHKHDCCYGDAEYVGCKTKMGHYHWTCKDKTVKCDKMKDKCQKMMCKCDSELAQCLSRTSYNSKYALYPNFLCGNSRPACIIYKD